MSHSIHPAQYQDHISKGRPEPREEHVSAIQAEEEIRQAINYLVLKGKEFKEAQQIVGEKGAKAVLAERE